MFTENRSHPLVTATEYGVSTMSGDGIEGVLLSVYKHVPDPTPEYPMRTKVVYAVKDMPFPNQQAADEYCVQMGWCKFHSKDSWNFDSSLNHGPIDEVH